MPNLNQGQPQTPYQASTETVAKGLLGDLASRWGDVLGTRDATAVDVARDFSIGMSQGQGRLEELKLKVAEQYEARRAAAARQAGAEERASQAKVRMLQTSLANARKLPPGHRVSAFKETLDLLGVGEEASPAALKLLMDEDATSDQLVDDLLADSATVEEAITRFGSVNNFLRAKDRIEATRARQEQTAAQARRLELAEGRFGLASAREAREEAAFGARYEEAFEPGGAPPLADVRIGLRPRYKPTPSILGGGGLGGGGEEAPAAGGARTAGGTAYRVK